MKLRSKRWYAKNGASVKRRRRNKADRRNDPEIKAMRDAITAQKRAEGHPGYQPPGQRYDSFFDWD